MSLDHEDALRAVEARVLKLGAGPWIATIEKMRRAEEAGDLALFADLLLSLRAPGIGEAAVAGILEAADLGAAHALDMLDSRAPRVVAQSDAVRAAGASALVPAASAERMRRLDLEASNALRMAERFAFTGARPDEILSPLRRSSNDIQRDVITTIHETASSSVVDVARVARARLVWVAERDACAHCLAMQGQVVDAGASPDFSQTYAARPLPVPPSPTSASRHPRCLPFDARVTPGSNVTGASVRMYDGEMVRIKTLSGQELTGTPNHPVLTRRGWVGLGLLQPGDQVVRRLGEERVIDRGDDGEHVPALIGELAEATLGALQVAATEVPLAAVDFHGDGGGSEVAVVASDGFLKDALDGPLCEHHRELFLEVAAERGLALAGERGAGEALLGNSASTDSGVSSLGPREALLGAGLGHTHGHSSAASPWRDIVLDESGADGAAGDAEAVRDAELALAGEVAFDDVLIVERFTFHGMVYNLETEGGWYIANGIVTHNCRCQWEVVYSDEYVDALKREADRSILRGFSLPNESGKVRVDAAARLLEKGVDAPKSVKAYAERAVRRGAFPTRAVPSG